MRRPRRWIADLVWIVALLVALILAAGALLVNLVREPETVVVRQVLDAARFLAGPFDGLLHFYRDGSAGRPGAEDVPLQDLVDWGMAAVGYLIVGRLLDLAIRPRGPQVSAGAASTPDPRPAEPGDAVEGSEASRRSP